MKILIRGKISGGKNNMRIDPRSGRHYPSPEFVEWRENAIAQIFPQLQIPFKKIEIPTRVNIFYWRGDERRHDTPAMEDALWHVLERTVVVDDSLLFPCWFPQGLDRKNPRVALELLPL